MKKVTLEQFNERLEEYRTENSLVDNLIKQLGSWEKFPPHLIEDLFKRMGCKPQVDKY